MAIALYILIALFFAIPGILMVLASLRFRSFVNSTSGTLFVIGALFVLIYLLLSSGTYFFSYFGTAEDLASYAVLNAWLGQGLEYVGLVLIAIGLFVHTAQRERD